MILDKNEFLLCKLEKETLKRGGGGEGIQLEWKIYSDTSVLPRLKFSTFPDCHLYYETIILMKGDGTPYPTLLYLSLIIHKFSKGIYKGSVKETIKNNII